jgi:alpha-methylacyl-CoA racemase
VTAALEGIRIVDLSTYVPGPYATRVLADLGADVVQIEPPVGDPMRHTPVPWNGDDAAGFIWLAQGKTSRVLDLKSDAGQEAFRALVVEADVVIESFTPGVADRLGVGYEACRRINPDVVYCSVSGDGQTGEYATTPGHDLGFLARAGVLDQIRGADGAPAAIGPLVGDMAGSLFAATAILAALLHRERTGEGQRIDIPLIGAALAMAAPQLLKHAAGHTPTPAWDHNRGADPAYRVYPARDGFVAVAGLEPKFWERMCERIGRPDLIERRASDAPAVIAELTTLFARHDRAHWVEIVGDDACFAPVNELDEVRDDPHVRAGGFIVEGADPGTWFPATPIRLSATPLVAPRPAPRFDPRGDA